MITYQVFMEKLFDGTFSNRTEQDEALEALQMFGKTVDSRKVIQGKITLRAGVFLLIKRPMTSSGTGFMIVKVDKEKDDERTSGNEIVINPIEEDNGNDNDTYETTVVKNYSGPLSFKVGSKIILTDDDAIAVSQDNKRFYIVYPPQQNSYQEPPSTSDDDSTTDDSDDDDKENDSGSGGLLSKLKSLK